MTATAHPRTEQEIDTLKVQWRNDPCWDIEETEGFAAHRDELLAYRVEHERRWTQERLTRQWRRAAELGVTVAALDIIEGLEREIDTLRRRVDQLEGCNR